MKRRRKVIVAVAQSGPPPLYIATHLSHGVLCVYKEKKKRIIRAADAKHARRAYTRTHAHMFVTQAVERELWVDGVH